MVLDKIIKASLLFKLFLIWNSFLVAQNVDFTVGDFITTGDARISAAGCFELTENQNWKGGGVWFQQAVDLKEAFSMEIELSFGCSDEGADGIVFIFHPRLTTGFQGEGMGFGGLYPSFGIEMDTYQNGHLGDPSYDHVSYMAHGNLRHYRGLTEPISLSSKSLDVEDCKVHKVKIIWLPNEKLVSFYFDGSLRVSEKIDLVDGIFGGDPNVFWGFTSATGGKTNRHMVCVNKLEFKEVIAFSYNDRKLLLNGGSYIINNLDFPSGSTVIPKKAYKELDNLLSFFLENSSHTIILDGFTDSSGSDDNNLRLSKLRAKAIADYLIKNGLSKDRIYYYGHGEKNPLESNANEEGRKKNRRIQVQMTVLKV